MKKLALCLILILAIMIPLACGNQNNAPTGPIGGSAATATFTSSPTKTNTPGGPTSTPTSLPAGANTPTFTPTFAVNTPVYENTYATSASPNGMVIAGGVMTLAEKQDVGAGTSTLQTFNLGASNGTTVASWPNLDGIVYQGIPTPGTTPAWVPVTQYLTGPQGFVNLTTVAGGPEPNETYAAVLDTSGAAATLYEGSQLEAGWAYYGAAYEPVGTNGYGSLTFNNPKAMTADLNGNIYISDTGNSTVEEFWGFDGPIYAAAPEHKFQGNAGITFVNNTAPANPVTFVSVVFKSPYGITCDPSGNVWVTDTGYSPSVVEEFSFSGAVTVMNGFQTVAGCVATGIAVAPAGSRFAGDVCVADSGNSQVEIYNSAGTLLSVLSDPHSAYEGNGFFAPSCVGFNAASSTYDLWVADTNNSFIISFK